MLDVLQFLFSSFWIWLGATITAVAISVIVSAGISNIIDSLRAN